MNAPASIGSVAELELNNDILRVAFASSDAECVNQHFGSSQGFEVYGITKDSVEHLATKIFAKEKKDGNEDKLKPKLAFLHGCDLVYCGSIGGSATKQLIMLGVHPIQVKGGPEIEEIIEEIQGELNGELSPMLDRVLKQKSSKSEDRFDSMEDEDWDE